MQTLPRHLESLSPSRDASPPPPAPITRPIPFSNVTKIILSPSPWAPLVITPWKLDTKREAWQSYVCYVFRARPRISPIDCNPFSSPTDSVERAITRLLEEERRGEDDLSLRGSGCFDTAQWSGNSCFSIFPTSRLPNSSQLLSRVSAKLPRPPARFSPDLVRHVSIVPT